MGAKSRVKVNVQGGNTDKALRDLKKKIQRELLPRVLKQKRFYESPSMKKVRKQQETQRRLKKYDKRRVKK